MAQPSRRGGRHTGASKVSVGVVEVKGLVQAVALAPRGGLADCRLLSGEGPARGQGIIRAIVGEGLDRATDAHRLIRGVAVAADRAQLVRPKREDPAVCVAEPVKASAPLRRLQTEALG